MSHETLMRRLARPMLLAAALIWGTSFFMMKNALDTIPVFTLLALRFTTGALLLALIFWKRWRLFTRDYVWRGAVMGAMLFLAYAVQTFGLSLTTPSNNAFLTAVYCVLVPFFTWAAVGRRPDRYSVIGAVLCVIGIGFVSLDGAFTMKPGDLLTLLCAVFYAAHITAVEKVSPGKDIYILTCLQFAFAALFSWAGSLLTETFPLQALRDPSVAFPLFWLCVMCTAVALLFQNVGQVWTDSSSAAVLLSLESVFGVLFSVLFYGDPVTPKLLTGFALIFLAVLCSQTRFSFLRRKEKK